ncbi:hypothetical protein CFR72_15805, partial [Gluconacetobacter entanii]
FIRPAAAAFNANQDFLGHSYLSNDVNNDVVNDVVNDGKLPVTILNHKAASNGRLRPIASGRPIAAMMTANPAARRGGPSCR